MTEETKEQEANAVAGGQNERLIMCGDNYFYSGKAIIENGINTQFCGIFFPLENCTPIELLNLVVNYKKEDLNSDNVILTNLSKIGT